MNDISSILIRPRITEKSNTKTASSVYVFEVSPKTSKNEIAKAIVQKYKTKPIKVSTVTIPAKSVFVRGKKGKKAGYKKAYVYLAKGQKLES